MNIATAIRTKRNGEDVLDALRQKCTADEIRIYQKINEVHRHEREDRNGIRRIN